MCLMRLANAEEIQRSDLSVFDAIIGTRTLSVRVKGDPMNSVAKLLVVYVAIALLASPMAAQQQPIYVHPIKPALPLFRCDGQRPPIFGAENCANWRLMKKQERLLDLQIKELEQRQKSRSPKAAKKGADQ